MKNIFKKSSLQDIILKAAQAAFVLFCVFFMPASAGIPAAIAGLLLVKAVKAGKSAKRLAFAFTAVVMISTISETASAVFKIALVALVLFMAYQHDHADTMDDTMDKQ